PGPSRGLHLAGFGPGRVPVHGRAPRPVEPRVGPAGQGVGASRPSGPDVGAVWSRAPDSTRAGRTGGGLVAQGPGSGGARPTGAYYHPPASGPRTGRGSRRRRGGDA